MPSAIKRIKSLHIALLLVSTVSLSVPVFASDENRKTPEQFAQLYCDTFNAHDLTALRKLRLPTEGKCDLQDMLDMMQEGAIKDGQKYTKVEILPLTDDVDKPCLGPDGVFYKPSVRPTNLMKLSYVGPTSSMHSTIPIGIKDGVYYEITAIPITGMSVPFAFGWQRARLPLTDWSVMMPNEPEPGRASLEKDRGKAGADDPDSYGVVKNTADIKTSQHWIRCAEEGKRISDPASKETYRAACTTFEPETLKKWFSDPKKNIDEAVGSATRDSLEGGLKKTTVTLNGAPGAEFEFKDSSGVLHLGRVYWVKDALYELTFVSKKESPDRAGATKFLDSLEVK